MRTIDNTCFNVNIKEVTTFSEIDPPVKIIMITVYAQLGCNRSEKYDTTTHPDDVKLIGVEGIIRNLNQMMLDDYN